MQTVFDPDYFERFNCRCKNIYGPKGAGKTTFLKAMKEYYKDKYVPFYLDFSDCTSKSYEEFIGFIRKKMSELYIDLWDTLVLKLYYSEIPAYMSIVEGTSDIDQLKDSLIRIIKLVNIYCHREYTKCRPIVFIDEISRPLVYGAKYGFEDEVQAFYDKFLDIDHYERTGGMITTSYAPINTDISVRLKYIYNKPINEIEPLASFARSNGLYLDIQCKQNNYFMTPRYFDEKVSLLECFEQLVMMEEQHEQNDFGIQFSENLLTKIEERKQWAREKEIEAEEAEKRRKEQERLEYLKPLSEEIKLHTKFAGTRILELEISNKEKYKQLNTILIELYKKFGANVNMIQVYDSFQKFARDDLESFYDDKPILDIGNYVASGNREYKCRIDLDDSYWGRFDFHRMKNDSAFNDLTLIKVYLSAMENSKIMGIFTDVVRYLIDEGKHGFHAKVSKYLRDDQMCFWVTREDFFSLEKYIEKFEEDLYTPLPFVAYRGKIGISREFYSWTSHNGAQAELIAKYLNQITRVEDIDIVDMYSMYVKAWNGECDAGLGFLEAFKSHNAQELIILLETIDLIINGREIDDNHILLSDDVNLWHYLGESKNWCQLERKLKESRFQNFC